MSTSPGMGLLRQLARLYGVQTSYHDMHHRRQVASPEALLAVLQQRGAPVACPGDAPEALRERRLALWKRPLEPVAVAWEGRQPGTELRLPSYLDGVTVRGHLALEGGEERYLEWRAGDLATVRSEDVDGDRYVAKWLPLPQGLPQGYHRLTLDSPPGPVEALVISAPQRAYAPPEEKGGRPWGVFLPLYSLQTRRSWGVGDLSDLQALMEWTALQGGGMVATLPLLAAYLDDPFEPSPYVPASRLLWNELYIDVSRSPELGSCPPALEEVQSRSFQEEMAALRSSSMVDYRRASALKRRLLEELARCCFQGQTGSLEEVHRFARANPVVDDYARFRAVLHRHQAPWPSWPQPQREGLVEEGDWDEEVRRYHLYVQWLAHRQMGAITGGRGDRGAAGLHLDMPLGVHPHGYDVWREQELFCSGVSVGAPRDSLFTGGQNWGFPPMHPERLREQGYRHYIACIRHQLRYADALRIDHVMGLHRLFWIPKGMEPGEGVYVRYRAQDLYAILALESHRSRAFIVGEDLGTVPSEVRSAMARHGINGTYVVQYELNADLQRPLRGVPRNSMASVNTHDTGPFSAFWQGLDIQDQSGSGLLDAAAFSQAQRHRHSLKAALLHFLEQRGLLGGADEEPLHVLRAILSFLSASPARTVLVNLEDLWLETLPQNVPGTGEERPNWRRKARFTLEEFAHMPEVLDTLQALRKAAEMTPLFGRGEEMNPRQSGTRAVTFRFNAAEAESVALAGNFNGWDASRQPLRRRKDGVWWVTLRLSPGSYAYKFVMNGSDWRADPLNPVREPDGYGSFNSVQRVA